jgi:predicted DNA-binding transcriptional regulator YafY
MESAFNKSERLAQLEQLLIANPQGLKRAEIARRLGVNRSTIGRYIDELSGRHDAPIPIYDDDGLVKINRDKYINYIGLTVHEAMAIHLATRLMATRTDKHNPHAAAALRKLGQSLETFAPFISQHVLASANVMDAVARRQDANYMRTLEILTRAWSDRQMVHIWHRYEDGGQVYEYDFAPYFIEPYAVGQTTHVIGWRKPPAATRTFKVERIERVELLADEYTIPSDFDPQARLADAWGIWYTEAEPVDVVLKFHPNVAGRVKETQWHRSEDVTEQPDGSLVWRAKIAEPLEMIHWIRGWGADCEILEPVALRETIMGEARRLAEIYGWSTSKVKAQDTETSSLSRTFGDFFGD